jgi:preprotein translocase subunit SecA
LGGKATRGPAGSYLSLEDDLMRIFAGEWVKNILTRLGMKRGEAIESRMVTRRIEGAQKKVEERNFEVRKNLLEYDEVMDEQRKRLYTYRQNILDGCIGKDLILEMIDGQVEHYLGKTYANWAGSRLSTALEPRDFRGMDGGNAAQHAIDEAERLAETAVLDAIEENLPDEEDEQDWNWEALAKFSNVRWGTNFRDRDLRKAGRDGVYDVLVEKGREVIASVDLSEGDRFLDPYFGVRASCGWLKDKFGLDIPFDEVKELESADLMKLACRRARDAYEEKECEYPVMAGLYRYTKRVAGGHGKIDREGLVEWAAARFRTQLDLEDIKSMQREDIRKVLLKHSAANQKMADESVEDVRAKVAELFGDADEGTIVRVIGNAESLTRWLRNKYEIEYPVDELLPLTRDEVELRMRNVVEDRYRPEIRRMERGLLLQIVDSAWKDHLLAMDYLRSAVGMRGYAQEDPKVEYKREGMRQYDGMWRSIGERVTDLVFRMEQLDEEFVGSTWVETSARHDRAASASEIAKQQEAAIDASRGGGEKVEPIRNRGQRVGRNDPCPCGSGKKYKKCCMAKERGTA